VFLGFALPPNIPEFARQLAWWGKVGGAGWCMLAMLPFLFLAGFDHLAASPTAGHARGGLRE
jgi:hypothetical protein